MLSLYGVGSGTNCALWRCVVSSEQALSACLILTFDLSIQILKHEEFWTDVIENYKRAIVRKAGLSWTGKGNSVFSYQLLYSNYYL